MLRYALRPAFIALALLGLPSAHADEATVKKNMEAFIGTPAVESVTKTPYGGLYEVVLNSGEIVYTDENTSFIIDGRVIDTKTRRDMTQARLSELSTIDFSTLPLNQAIKQVRGNGKRVLVSFEDPNCGYCKRLAKELAQVSDITVYTFLYPILSQDSHEKSKNIWCAQDRAKVWNDWMVEAKAPPPASCDAGVVEQNVALGRKLKINGTPTMFLSDGRRIGGYVPAADLERALGGAAN